MWDQYRYDIALGLGYATQAQKDLMLSLTESFVDSKYTYIKPDGVGGGNLALEAYIAIGLAGLNFPEHPDSQLWISRSVTNVKKIVDTYFPDGAGTESPRYHDWTLEQLAMYLRVLKRRANIDLYDEPGIRSALEWLIRFSSPPVSLTSNKSVTPAWGDSTYSSNSGMHYYYDLSLFAPAYRERDPDFSARLMEWWTRNGRPRDVYSATTSGLTNILMLDSRLPVAPMRPNSSTYSPRIGHATLRSGSGTDDEFFASFKCGTQGGAHQDSDIGHIDLFAFGVPLALDSTSGPYNTTAFNPAAAAHNTVRFNGAGAWDSVSGSFSAFGTSPSADYAVGDTNYGTVSNRHLVMMKGDYLVVWDETTASNYADWFFRVPGTATLDWQPHKVVSSTPWGVDLDIHFVLPAEPLVEPTFSGSFIPTGDTTALRNQLASQATDPAAPGMFTMMGENRFGDGSTSRNPFPFDWLKYFSVRNASSAGDFLTVLHPRKAGVTPALTTELVSSSASGVTVRVTYNGRVDTIAFTSTGATVTKGNEPSVQFTKSWPQSGASGATGFVKADFYTSPVTTLSNALTTTGPVEVHTGELALGAANRIPNTATLRVMPGGTFNLKSYSDTVGTLVMDGGIVSGSGTLTASSLEWWGGKLNAPVSVNGNFIKKGGVSWSRPANLTYSGDTIIESGTLAMQSGGTTLPGTNRAVLGAGTSLQVSGSSASVASLDVAGNATVATGTGALTVTGSLTGIGTLSVSGNLNLSTATIASTVSLSINGSLTLLSGAVTVKRLFINGVIQRAGIAVNAASFPGVIVGSGSITPLEDIGIPTGLTASVSLGKVTLTWLPVEGVTTYSVRRATTAGGPYTEIGVPGTNSFIDTGVTDGVTYYYVVVSRSTVGDSLPSAEVTALASGPWYFDPNGATGGSVTNGGSYDWVTNSWTKTPGGTTATEASGPLRHVQFAATSPGLPLAYSVTVGSNFSGAAHGFRSMRVTQGTVTLTGTPGNFYFTEPPVITADAGTTIRFAQTGSLAFNLNRQTVTFDGDGTTIVGSSTVIVNTGNIVKTGSGTLVLTASNTFAGSLSILGGTVRLAVTDLPTLWLDATNPETLVNSGTALVQWNDANGRGTYVSQSTEANQPVLTTDATLTGPAKSLVDFGPYAYYSTATPTTADWMQFNAAMTDIRAMFWVGKTSNNNFLLGSTATDYHFHSGGPGAAIWNSTYASASIRSGTTWLNGTTVTGTTTIMPAASNLVRIGVFTTANVNANTLARDRTYRYGGEQIGEVMIFNTTLTSQQQLDVDAYLAKKWFNTGVGVGNRLPVATPVTLGNGGVLDLTGVNFQTLAALNASDGSGSRVQLGGADLTIDGTGNSWFDGTISGGGRVIKSGSGTFTLAGENDYTGATNVNAGTFLVDGLISSPAALTVASVAKIGGEGTIASPSTIGGTVAPGNGVGTIVFTGSLNFSSTARIEWELGDNAIDAGDRINAGGTTVSAGAAINLAFGSAVNFTNAFWSTTRTFPVLAATALSGTFALGTPPVDSGGRNASWFGAFTLQHTGTGVNLVWTPASAWQQWQAARFGANWSNAAISGPTVDGDKDGLSNLMEFALALDPNAPDTVPANLVRNGQNLEYTYTRNKNATGVTYLVEYSDTLAGGSWSSSGVEQNPTPSFEDTNIQTLKVIVPAGSGPKRFVRLKVTTP